LMEAFLIRLLLDESLGWRILGNLLMDRARFGIPRRLGSSSLRSLRGCLRIFEVYVIVRIFC
jgi:hypothetical protein